MSRPMAPGRMCVCGHDSSEHDESGECWHNAGSVQECDECPGFREEETETKALIETCFHGVPADGYCMDCVGINPFPPQSTIYLIEERRAPSKDGPWSEWSAGTGVEPSKLFPRARTCAEQLNSKECEPHCMSIGAEGSVYRQWRCIPHVRVEHLTALQKENKELREKLKELEKVDKT